jgi:hypothetical protein
LKNIAQRVFAGKKVRTEIPFDQGAQGADQLRKLEREEDVMGSIPDRSVQLLASILICGIATTISVAAKRSARSDYGHGNRRKDSEGRL